MGSCLARRHGRGSVTGHAERSHRAQRVAVEEISAERNDPHIKTAYALAGKFHSNFYHGFMEEEDWAHESPIVRDFTEHMLGLVENGQLPQGA